MSSSFTALPLPLILLIHLHILDYPHTNESQYDKDLFNGRSKGLKDRVRMMEDICYFLISQLEANARNILPTYPCTRPSDNLAFRTSLFKYLETLRHRTLYSSSQKGPVNAQRGHKNSESSVPEKTAWWWRDVMVRKSLLEECAGERFECLLVAFSTHVLFHKSNAYYTKIQLLDLAATASFSYNTMLLRYQSTRCHWDRQANLLAQRRQKIHCVKRAISAGRNKVAPNTIALGHLVALVKVKYSDIQSRLWPGERGSAALAYLLQLACVENPHDNVFTLFRSEKKHTKLAENQIPARPPLLSLAAAHHPTELERLRQFAVSSSHRTRTLHMNPKPKGSIQMLFFDILTEVKAVHMRLSETFLSIQKKRNLLRMHTSRGSRPHEEQLAKRTFLLQKPIIDCAFLERFSLCDPTADVILKQRIDYIRQNVLPSFPSPPDLTGACVTPPELENPASKKSQPKYLAKTCQRTLSGTEDTSTPRNARILEKSRKTIRTSPVHNMIKQPSDERKQMFEDEAAKIILETKDDSTEDIEFATPRAKAPPNRLWTSGQKGTPTNSACTPRRSLMMMFKEPSARLPLVPSTSTGSMSRLEDEANGDQMKPVEAADGALEDAEQSQTSMTLRELLLATDSSDFTLIEDEGEDYVEEYSGWE